MAGSSSQKELLNLIRGVSTENTQGERRVVNLKRQIQQLQSELDSVNLELEEAKRLKECTEQELKGYEVELAVKESSIQTLEGRISLLQDEVSTIVSDLETVKSEEGALRDDFIGKMFDLNAKIRKFQQSVDFASSNTTSLDVETENANNRESEEAKRDLEDKLAQIISETGKKEHEIQSEQNFHMQEQKELDDLKHRISLMEAIMDGSKELQELAILQDLKRHVLPLVTSCRRNSYVQVVIVTMQKCWGEFFRKAREANFSYIVELAGGLGSEVKVVFSDGARECRYCTKGKNDFATRW